MSNVTRPMSMPMSVSDLRAHIVESAGAITATCTDACVRAASRDAPTGEVTLKFDGEPDEAQVDVALASFGQ